MGGGRRGNSTKLDTHTHTPLVLCRTMEEKVRKVPRRLVGCRERGTLDPSGVVGVLGTSNNNNKSVNK